MTLTTHIRVLLVDDHALVRESVRRFLDAEPEITVIATAANAKEAISLAAQNELDVILMDIDMPGLDCFDAAERIRSQGSSVEVVFLSAFFHDLYIERALAVRAAGYLTKSEPPSKVVDAIRQVARGRVYFSPEISDMSAPPPQNTSSVELTPIASSAFVYCNCPKGLKMKDWPIAIR